MPAIELVCARCGATFVATRRTARFCSERCRRDAYAEKRKLAQTREFDLRRVPDTTVGEGGYDQAARDDRFSRQSAVLVGAQVKEPQAVVAQIEQPQAEQPQVDEARPEPAAPARKPVAAVGGFVVLPPVMLVLGLLLIILGQLVAGLIEVAAAIALFTGFHVWGSRRA